MCDGSIEPDLWQALITAGACWRAAKAQPSMRAAWEASAAIYSLEAEELLEWDMVSWRWPLGVDP